MIEPDDTIRFEKDDVPDMPEIRKLKKPKHKKHEEPEPTDWRPLGMEW
jgi:hypothetical protein